MHAKGGDGAVGLHRGLEVRDLRAAVGGRCHVLDARLRPAHGHAKEPSYRGEGRVLGVDAELDAEASAHLRGDHPHQVLLEAEAGGDVVAQHVRRLGGRPQGEATRGGIGHGESGPRLHGHSAQPLAHHALPHHLVRLGEGGVGLTHLDGRLVLDVVRRVVEELGRTRRHGRELIGYRGQGLPGDHHVGCSVHGRRLGGGDHRRHRLADVAHVADGQRIVPPAHARGRPTSPFRAGAPEGNGLAVRAQILARHHLEHARALGGRRGVDRAHLGVGVRAAHERDVV